jgi:hypothetical protein
MLAARDDTEIGGGLHFVTWQYDVGYRGLSHGHYTEDFHAALEDFSLRTGLVPEAKILTKEQAADIAAAIDYRIKNDGELTLAQEDALNHTASQLRRAYAAKEEAEPAHSALEDREPERDVLVDTEPAQSSEAINGSVKIGDYVIVTPNDDYGCLVGQVKAIEKAGTPEHDTDNPGDDIHVDFTSFDYPPWQRTDFAEHFSELYGEPKTFDEIPLNDVIIAPDALIRVTELETDEINRFVND